MKIYTCSDKLPPRDKSVLVWRNDDKNPHSKWDMAKCSGETLHGIIWHGFWGTLFDPEYWCELPVSPEEYFKSIATELTQEEEMVCDGCKSPMEKPFGQVCARKLCFECMTFK